MIVKKWTKNRLGRAIFGCLFAILGMFGLMMSIPANVYAEPAEATVNTTASESTTSTTSSSTTTTQTGSGASCEDSLGSLGWLVCPTTGKISEAVDWLYDKIEDILVIDPVERPPASGIS